MEEGEIASAWVHTPYHLWVGSLGRETMYELVFLWLRSFLSGSVGAGKADDFSPSVTVIPGLDYLVLEFLGYSRLLYFVFAWLGFCLRWLFLRSASALFLYRHGIHGLLLALFIVHFHHL